MLREIALLLTDALRDPTYGVLATLPSVPRAANDPDPIGRAGTIYVVNEYDTEQVALGGDLDIIPALIVLIDGPADVAGDRGRGQVGETVRVTVLYYDRADNLLRAKAAGAVVMRAVRKCLNRYCGRTSQEDRTLHQIRLLEVTRLMEARYPDERRGKATLTGGVQATIRVLDLDP